MDHRAVCRILGVVTAAIMGTTLGAAPAIADVTMTPGQAVQGEAAKLTFRVTEDRAPAYTTTIELLMPESAPVAETYPMSVPDWAPRITMRKVDQTLGGIHHGQVTEVVERITWTRAGASGAEAGPAELVISLGPMPQLNQMTFALVQTYSDGHVTHWNQSPSAEVPQPPHPAPVLTLAPPSVTPGPADAAASQADAPDRAGAPGDNGDQGYGSLAVGLVIGLLGGLALAGWQFLRRRADATTGPVSGTTRDTPPTTSLAGESAETPAGASGDPEATAAPSGDRAPSGRAWRLRE